MESLKEILELLNPWWKEGQITKELARPYKRKLFNKLFKLVSYKQIIIISGLRRIGKTTLIYQLIEHLLKKSDPKMLLYFSFDKEVDGIIEILNAYNEITGINWEKSHLFVFLDEVTKLHGWANKIKLVYDAFPNLKFIISSSGSTLLEQEAIKALAGRYFLINLKPLSFIEFLELKNKSEYIANQGLWEKEIKRELNLYLIRTFPEIIEWKDELLIKDYLRTTIIDKIIKMDIQEKFRNINRDLLFDLMKIFYSEPGMILDYDGLSKKLRVSKKTLSSHIFYLEFSYLIKRIKNYRINVLSASKKLQKIYGYWWNLVYCYPHNSDKLIENIVANTLDVQYYWRKNGKEIDFIFINKKKLIPVEIKNKNEIRKSDIQTLKYFLAKYKLKEGYIIYLGEEDEMKFNQQRIKLIPLWKFLLKPII